jgi:6-phosphogluconolactonase
VLEIFADRETVCCAAADLFAHLAQKAVASQGRFSVLLSGGDTPRRAYELLAAEPLRSKVPWKDTHIFWGDERCVPHHDRRSNAAMAQSALLSHVPIPAHQIHPIAVGLTPRAAAEQYQAELAAHFADTPPRFDLAILGLGEDGHTASLFPGSQSLWRTSCWTAVSQRDDEEFSRITLTPVILNQAQTVLFLVAGSGKARVLQAILDGSDRGTALPARLIRPCSGDLRWFVDREAAALLSPDLSEPQPRR